MVSGLVRQLRRIDVSTVQCHYMCLLGINHFSYTKSVDPDQTLHVAASGLGLHSLSMPLL